MSRAPLVLFALALVLHGAWGLTIPVPEDWDAQYYLSVARHLAAGDGAVTSSLWSLAVLPAALPLPADLHWMPLPSRVLVPGLLLWPAHGDQLVNALLAACWAPLAWALTRCLGGSDRDALLAGALAGLGGLYPRLLSTPDTYALYGALGGAAMFAAARGRAGLVALALVGAALTRNDGFLLAPCLALAARSRREAILIALSGPLAAAAWGARCWLVAGQDWLDARWLAANAHSYVDLYAGSTTPLSIGERLSLAAGAAPQVAEAWVLPGLAVLTLPALYTAWQLRGQAAVRAGVAYLLVIPPVLVLLAPVVAAHGSLPRSMAALMPLHCALAAVGLRQLGALAAAKRGYPTWFVPGLLAGAFAVISVGFGAQRALERDPAPCAAVADLPAGAPVFSSEPLALEAACGRPGVMLLATVAPEQAAELARRYGVRHALTTEGVDEGGLTDATVPALLPGWRQDGPNRWSAPE